MDFDYEQIGVLTREYTISVTHETLLDRVQNYTNEVAAVANLKGFRKGKAPRKVITQRYGSEIHQEMLDKLVSERCRTILEEEKELTASWIGRPYLVESQEHVSYTFKARVENFPKVELGDLSEVVVVRPVVDLSEAAVASAVNLAREGCIDWYELRGEGVEIQAGDRVEFTWQSRQTTAGESANEDKDKNEQSDQSDRLKISLLSPRNDLSREFHEKFVGKKLNDRIEVSREELLNEFPEIERDLSEKPSIEIIGIEIGDLPLIESNRIASLGLDPFIPEHLIDTVASLNDFQVAAKDVMADRGKEYADQIVRTRAIWEVVKRNLTVLPRKTLFEEFRRAPSLQQAGIGHPLLLEQIFDLLLEGRTGEDNQSIHGSTAHDDDRQSEEKESSDQLDQAAINEIANTITERDRSQLTTLIDSTMKRMSLRLMQEAVAEKYDIEPDQDWVSERIKIQVENASRIFNDNQDYLDWVYSEENYRNLANESVWNQCLNQILEEVTFEEQTVTLRTLIWEFEKAEEGVLASLKIAPSIPLPKAASVTADRPTEEPVVNGSEGELVDAKGSDEAIGVSESMLEDQNRSETLQEETGFFKRLLLKVKKKKENS